MKIDLVSFFQENHKSEKVTIITITLHEDILHSRVWREACLVNLYAGADTGFLKVWGGGGSG